MRKQMRKTLCLLPLASALLLSGCISLAPEYERPEAPVEQVWPQDEATKSAALLTEGLQKWSDFFTDERLTKLIELGLQNNRSLRSAFYSVEQARAQYNVRTYCRRWRCRPKRRPVVRRLRRAVWGAMLLRTPTRPTPPWRRMSWICLDASAI